MNAELVDCITHYLTGSKKSGACGQFSFEGEIGYLDGQKISRVVDGQKDEQKDEQKARGGTKKYLLIYVRVHHLCDVLMQIADRLGVEEIILPDVKLLDGVEGWDELFFNKYVGHIRAAARTDSDVQFKYRVMLANRTHHQAKNYATVFGLDWDSVAHWFTPENVLADDLDLLTRFALRDMGVESV